MKICIDDNNILSIENENIPKTKKFAHNVSGYNFKDFDKGIIVYHKKQFKIINLKDLGDKMGIFMIGEHDNEYDEMTLDISSMESALKLFDGFNEDTGERYYFLPKMSDNKTKELDKNLKKLGSKIQLKRTEKGITHTMNGQEELVYNPISFLFGLALVFGTFQIKNGDFKAIKLQVHLFGKYTDSQDIIDEMIEILGENGLFVNKNIQKSADGIIYEITSSDYELLGFLAKFYEPIENGLKISKYDEVEEIKTKLLDFVQTNPEIPNEGKNEVLEQIKNGMVKIMYK